MALFNMFRKFWHKASQGTFTPLGVGRLATHLVMAASSSAAGPDAKRRRMRGLVGLKGVTTEALARVLADVREHGPLDLSPWQVNSFISSEYRRVSHTLMVPKAGGGHFEWPISRADTLLQYFCDECPRFRDEVGEVLARGQHSLGAVLYLDEVVPGNLLRPDNKRKFWAFYLGIEEFGPSRLFQEEFWMPLAVLRSNLASSAEGGLSQCVRLLWRSILFEPSHLASAGVALDVGRPRLVTLRASRLIGDEAALKAVWMAKGAAGTRPCFLCANVVAVSSGLVGVVPHVVDPSCSDPNLLQAMTDQDVWSSFDRLAAAHGRETKREFAALQQASGLTFHPRSILADIPLREHIRPIAMTNFDWMHNFAVGGVFNTEMHAMLLRCKEVLGIRYAQFDCFVQAAWTFPSWQHTHQVSEVFSIVRERAGADTFKATASEILMVYPLVREFIVSILRPAGGLEAECESMLHLCGVLDLLLLAKKVWS